MDIQEKQTHYPSWKRGESDLFLKKIKKLKKEEKRGEKEGLNMLLLSFKIVH